MGNGHAHNHSGLPQQRLWIALGLTAFVCLLEIIGGLWANSLALLADAGHLFADVVAIGLSIFAGWIATRPASPERTFGFYRAEILVAVLNALILLALSVTIFVSAVGRLADPPETSGGLTMIIAAVGLVANIIALWLLKEGASTLNGKAVLMELASDGLGSVAILISGLLVVTTGFHRADAIASILIAVLIIPRTWVLLREAVDVLLEATPRGVDMDDVRSHILGTSGVTAVHDLHAWTIASGMPVLSAHVVIEADATHANVLAGLSDCLSDHFDIAHSTFQLESPDHVETEHDVHH